MDLTQKCVLTDEMSKLVAETMRVSLFDYAFDSDKVPSLNLHFFCYDYLETQSLVDKKMMDEGNMLPLCEELEYLISSSVWKPSEVTNAIFSFRTRLRHGEYEDLSSRKNDVENGFKGKKDYYRHSVEYLAELFTSESSYAQMLLNRISFLLDESYPLENRKQIIFCTREFLSELINEEVSKQHLFYQVNKKLYQTQEKKDGVSDKDFLRNFLCNLLPEEKEYEVIFGIDNDVHNSLSISTKYTRQATKEEINSLKAPYVCHFRNEIMPITAYDYASALSVAKEIFSSCLAAYNLGLHAPAFSPKPNGLVKKVGEEKFSLIKDSSNTLRRIENRRQKENEKVLRLMFNERFDTRVEELFSLHNSALLAQNKTSQLLNLWTIIEVAIDTRQSFACRINYITDMLTPVLSIIYYKRLIERLYKLIAKNKEARRCIKKLYPDNNAIEGFALCIKNGKTDIKAFFDENLYMGFQFEHLTNLFSSKKNVLSDWNRHLKRVRWQLARIYKTRCMIVHDGGKMPYIENLVENLHYYVDELFNYIIYNTERGIVSLDAIFSAARIKECQIQEFLKPQKDPSLDAISDEDFIKYFIAG